MLTKVFTVYDSKMEAYLAPFYAQAQGSAIRMFSDSINDKNHAFGKHPEDYTLFEIGSYDELTGTLIPLTAHKSLGTGVDFIVSH